MATSPTVGRVTSWYGKRKAPLPGASTYHRGVDIGAPAGTPVVAPLAGTITIAATSTVRGNYVVVRHDARWSTLHQHLGTISVRPGQTVAEGQAVGTVGATGVATAAHLHTEVHDHGTPIDPRPWYAARGVPTLGVRTKVAGVSVKREFDMFVTRYGSSSYYLCAGDRMASISATSYTKLAAAGIPAVALDNAEVERLRAVLTAETGGPATVQVDTAALADAVSAAVADAVTTALGSGLTAAVKAALNGATIRTA